MQVRKAGYIHICGVNADEESWVHSHTGVSAGEESGVHSHMGVSTDEEGGVHSHTGSILRQ